MPSVPLGRGNTVVKLLPSKLFVILLSLPILDVSHFSQVPSQVPYVDNAFFTLFLSEVEVLEHIGDSPYLVKFVGGAVSPKFMYVLTEYEPGGSLEAYLASNRPSAELRLRIMLDIARGMAVIHGAGVIHRNLKPVNVMMAPHARADSAVVCRVTDFGFSRLVGDGTLASTMTAGVGSPLYMAPELAAGAARYARSADVFSYAVTCVEVWNGARAYSEYAFRDPFALMAAVAQRGVRPGLRSDCPPALCALLQQCWATDPSSRPTFPAIVSTLLQSFPSLNGVSK